MRDPDNRKNRKNRKSLNWWWMSPVALLCIWYTCSLCFFHILRTARKGNCFRRVFGWVFKQPDPFLIYCDCQLRLASWAGLRVHRWRVGSVDCSQGGGQRRGRQGGGQRRGRQGGGRQGGGRGQGGGHWQVLDGGLEQWLEQSLDGGLDESDGWLQQVGAAVAWEAWLVSYNDNSKFSCF